MELDTRHLESAQLVAAMFEHAPHGIAMADLDGRYVKANPAFLRLLGYTEAELLQKTIHDVTHPDGYLHKDGRAIRVRNTVSRVPGPDGAPRYLLALVEELPLGRQSDEEQELREEKALLEAAFKLQALTRRLVQVEELERHRIAAELHDRVGQNLSALNINLDIALGMLPKESLEVRVRLADSLGLVEGTLQTIENLMAELRPPLLDEYGVAAALGLFVQGFAQRNGLSVAVDDPLEVSAGLRREPAIALFRIAQEALSNVAKHAGAKKVRVLLEKHDNEIVLDISDDGRGFDPRERLAHSTRWGMTTIHERAAAVGGRVEVHSTLGGGTTVRVTLPETPGGAP